MSKMLVASCLVALLGGCATFIHGTRERIFVESEPPGATIISQGRELGETPQSIVISRKTKDITLKKDNYKPRKIELKPEFNLGKAWLANFGVSGLSGVLFFTPIGQAVLTNDKLGPAAFLAWAGWLLVGGLIIGPILDGMTGAAYDFSLPNRDIHIALEETDSVKFERAKGINSIEAYERFLKTVHDTSLYAARARRVLDTLMFHRAQHINTAESYREYLRDCPKVFWTEMRGVFWNEATAKLRALEPECFSARDPTDLTIDITVGGRLMLQQACLCFDPFPESGYALWGLPALPAIPKSAYALWGHPAMTVDSVTLDLSECKSGYALLGLAAVYVDRVTLETYTLWLERGSRRGVLQYGMHANAGTKITIVKVSLYVTGPRTDPKSYLRSTRATLTGMEGGLVVDLNDTQLAGVLRAARISGAEWHK